MQSAAAVALMPLRIFAAYTAAVNTAAVTHNNAGQTSKMPIPLGDLDPIYATPSVATGRIYISYFTFLLAHILLLFGAEMG